MQDFLLFLDTETTGLPTRWDRPYSASARHWPYVAQLAWLVYTKAGELVKAETHYLRVPAGQMQPRAEAIHGLSEAFLREHGTDPTTVLQRLLADLGRYRPLVVAHYVRLDFHVLGAAFHRLNLPNLLAELPTFCTMQVRTVVEQGRRRQLRLPELYELLFATPLLGQHDAEVDAQAAARCFFELQARGEITAATVAGQAPLAVPRPGRAVRPWWWLVGGVGMLILIFWLLYGA